MTGESENLILELLRKMRGEQQAMALDVLDIKARLSALEELQGQVFAMFGTMNKGLDRFDERLSRIERRLDLVEEPQG